MEAICVIAAFLSAGFDLKTREIPDWITWPLILAGAVFSLLERGLVVTAGTLAVGGALCELLFRVRAFGGGDLKLLLGLSLAGGPVYGLTVFYASLVAFWPLYLAYRVKDGTKKHTVPYAVAIVLGVVWAWWRRSGLW